MYENGKSSGVLYLMAKARSLNVIPPKKFGRLSIVGTSFQRFFLAFRNKACFDY